ncbi:MAG: acyltransferase, partial [Actinobacteria bacterium]|nr:acyltransferase [Actinomycetota bacterium]
TRAYRPDIDGLRALAVLLVVAYHAGLPGIRGGYIGVDVFFVISGFLITGLLLDEHRASGRIDLRHFWSRRIRRIVPALVLAIVTTIAVSRFVLLSWEERDLLESARAAVASFANFHFHGMSGGYFSPTLEAQPLSHTWSLGIEEQFYLVWPIALMGLLRFGRRTTAVATSTFLMLSLIASSFAVASNLADAFYLPWFRLWELLIGALLAMGLRSTRIFTLPRWMAFVGGGAIIASAVLYDSTTRFPGLSALLPTLGTALVIASPTTNGLNRVLATRPLRSIGLVSYSWYLLHWPALVLVRVGTQTDNTARDVLVALATLPLAAISWATVERWFRTPHHAAPPRPALTISSGLASIGAVLIAATVMIPRPLLASTPTEAEVVDLATSSISSTTPTSTEAEVVDWSERPGELEASRVIPNLDCTMSVLALPFDETCEMVPGDDYVVLVGDSHAASIAPVFANAARRNSIGLRVTSQPRCPVLPDVEVKICEVSYDDCTWWVREVLRDIVEHADRVRAVALTARSAYYFPGSGLADDKVCEADLASPEGTTSSGAEGIWSSALVRLGDLLHEHGIPLVVVSDVPELRNWPSECLARRSVDDCAVGRAELEAYSEAARRAEATADEEREWITRVDPLDVLCGPSLCLPAIGDVIVYRDDHHLTASGSLLLADQIDSAISRVITD